MQHERSRILPRMFAVWWCATALALAAALAAAALTLAAATAGAAFVPGVVLPILFNPGLLQ